MALGPIEIVTLVFPGSQFNGEIVPELSKLVESGTITIVDGVFVAAGADGVDVLEFDEISGDSSIDALSELIQGVNGLISDEDVTELTAGLAPGSSAAILVFEHTWVKPLRDAIFASGGEMLESIRVPGPVVEEVLAAVEELADES
jgi:hypothetical protein